MLAGGTVLPTGVCLCSARCCDMRHEARAPAVSPVVGEADPCGARRGVPWGSGPSPVAVASSRPGCRGWEASCAWGVGCAGGERASGCPLDFLSDCHRGDSCVGARRRDPLTSAPCGRLLASGWHHTALPWVACRSPYLGWGFPFHSCTPTATPLRARAAGLWRGMRALAAVWVWPLSVATMLIKIWGRGGGGYGRPAIPFPRLGGWPSRGSLWCPAVVPPRRLWAVPLQRRERLLCSVPTTSGPSAGLLCVSPSVFLYRSLLAVSPQRAFLFFSRSCCFCGVGLSRNRLPLC